MNFFVDSPLWLAASLAGASVGALAVARRWRGAGTAPRGWFAPAVLAACVLLALAVGGLGVHWQAAPRVLVLVDASESAAPAAFGDPGVVASIVDRLLPRDARREIARFADGRIPAGAASGGVSRARTRLPSGLIADADAVLLFSDGQFPLPDEGDLPPATFAVIDPNLRALTDASIARLELRGDELVATVRNSGAARRLRWSWAPDAPVEIPPGGGVFAAPAPRGRGLLSAALEPGDAFPQNDVRSVRLPPPPQGVRRWLTDGVAPSPPGWLPTPVEQVRTPIDLIDASVVAVANLPVERLSLDAVGALTAYARDFGGTLVLTGGASAFAAGGWTGSSLDLASPLASSPPQARTLWLLLLDASGSMTAPATAGDAATRWDRALETLRELGEALPPADLVMPGSFARSLIWWLDAPQPVARMVGAPETVRSPPEVAPRGPTNLEAALSAIAREASASTDGLRRVVLLITDGEATFTDAAGVSNALRSAGVMLLVLSIDPDAPPSALDELAAATGGRRLTEPDARRWTAAAARLTRAAQADDAAPAPLAATVRLAEPLNVTVAFNALNPTWLRDGATPLGSATASPNATRPVAAMWRFGLGRVAAAAFADDNATFARAAADALARAPIDGRFRVEVSETRPRVIRVDAVETGDRGTSINDLPLRWRFAGGGVEQALRQVAPGAYEAELPEAGEAGDSLLLLLDAQPVARVPVSSRPAEEFDAIGLNLATLHALTDATGGRVIDPATEAGTPINLPRPTRRVALRTWLCASAALLLLVAMLIDRLRG